jgi:hypothetical protein
MLIQEISRFVETSALLSQSDVEPIREGSVTFVTVVGLG